MHNKCQINPASSRVCERGTKSCTVHHATVLHNKCQLLIKPDHCTLEFLDTAGNVSMTLDVKDIEMIGLQGDRWVMVKDRECEVVE